MQSIQNILSIDGNDGRSKSSIPVDKSRHSSIRAPGDSGKYMSIRTSGNENHATENNREYQHYCNPRYLRAMSPMNVDKLIVFFRHGNRTSLAPNDNMRHRRCIDCSVKCLSNMKAAHHTKNRKSSPNKHGKEPIFGRKPQTSKEPVSGRRLQLGKVPSSGNGRPLLKECKDKCEFKSCTPGVLTETGYEQGLALGRFILEQYRIGSFAGNPLNSINVSDTFSIHRFNSPSSSRRAYGLITDRNVVLAISTPVGRTITMLKAVLNGLETPGASVTLDSTIVNTNAPYDLKELLKLYQNKTKEWNLYSADEYSFFDNHMTQICSTMPYCNGIECNPADRGSENRSDGTSGKSTVHSLHTVDNQSISRLPGETIKKAVTERIAKGLAGYEMLMKMTQSDDLMNKIGFNLLADRIYKTLVDERDGIYLFSVHDSTISTILNGLKIKSFQIPSYASAVIIKVIGDRAEIEYDGKLQTVFSENDEQIELERLKRKLKEIVDTPKNLQR